MSPIAAALFAAAVVCALDAAAECLQAKAEGQRAEGRLARVRFVDVDYGNRVEFAFILNLAKPACLDGEDEYDKVASTPKIHVFSMDKAVDRRLRASIGRRIRVLGCRSASTPPIPRADCDACHSRYGAAMKYAPGMNVLALLTAALLAGFSPARADPRENVLKELAPTGTLRVAISVGPTASAFYCTRDPLSGRPRGVAVDLGAELSRMLRVPVEYVEYRSSGEITEAGKAGAWDVTFMPVDAERATAVEFGPAYYNFESTYLVPAGSAIKTIEEVDRPGVRVIGVENTATGRAAAAALKNAKLVTFRSVAELMDEMRAGRADAVALSRESLRNFAAAFPGARVLAGHFFTSRVAVAVPKGRSEALAFVTAFVENAKFTGSVRRALDGAGLKEADGAPPATQKN